MIRALTAILIAGMLAAAGCQPPPTAPPAPPSEAQPARTEPRPTPTPPWTWPTANAAGTEAETPDQNPTQTPEPAGNRPMATIATAAPEPPTATARPTTPSPANDTEADLQQEATAIPTPTEVPPLPTLGMEEAYTGSLEDRNLSPLSLEAHTGYGGIAEQESACIQETLDADASAAGSLGTKAMACLTHRNRIRVLIDPLLESTGIISRDTSDCILGPLWQTDFDHLIREGDQSLAYAAARTAGTLIMVYCLSGEEIAFAEQFPISNTDRYKMYCTVNQMGGKEETARKLTAAPEQGMAEMAETVAECTPGTTSHRTPDPLLGGHGIT